MKISELNPKLEIRPSSIEGRGILARELIHAGEVVITEHDDPNSYTIMTEEEFEAHKKTNDSWDAIAIGNGMHKVGTSDREDEESNFGNHSCDPNTAVSKDGTVALRDINPGEEVTIDYAQFSDVGWEMQCKCGSQNCKKIVKGTVK